MYRTSILVVVIFTTSSYGRMDVTPTKLEQIDTDVQNVDPIAAVKVVEDYLSHSHSKELASLFSDNILAAINQLKHQFEKNLQVDPIILMSVNYINCMLRG